MNLSRAPRASEKNLLLLGHTPSISDARGGNEPCCARK